MTPNDCPSVPLRRFRGWLYPLALAGFTLALCSAKLGAAADVVALHGGVPVVVAADAPASVVRAAQDLQRDLGAVFGQPSPLVRAASNPSTSPAIVVSTHPEAPLAGPEAHAVRVAGSSVRLEGGDARGAIYAIYSFSQRFLGVPPLWYWQQLRPTHRDVVEIARDTNLEFAPAAIRYRTWFPNDTDMLHPWLDADPRRLDAMLEALLRLKCNVLDVDYISDLPEPSRGLVWARACRDRGIMVTSTHTAPFGIRWTPGWDPYWRLVRHQEPPKLLLANQDKFWEFWRYYIELAQREHLEMLWQIAFRGDFDKKMSLTFPDAGENPHVLAPLVERMLKDEVAFLKKVTGDPHPAMRAVMFDEVGQYYSQGLLNPPEEPSLVWTFGNDKTAMIPYPGCLDRVPPAAQRLGFYFNIQYTAVGSHLAEAQSPSKIQQVIQLMQRRSPVALGELMLNVGNIRDFPLGISAGATLAWEGSHFDPAAFTEQFCRSTFGPEHAAEVARLYDALFDAYWAPHAPQAYAPVKPQYLFTDLKTARYIEAVLQLLHDGRYDGSPIKNSYWQGSLDPKFVDGSSSQLDAILVGNGVMIRRLSALARQAEALGATIPEDRRRLFQTSIGDQIQFLAASNQLLSQLIRAAKALPDRAEVAHQLDVAAHEADATVAALRDWDYGVFATWHDNAGKNGFRAADYLKEVRSLRVDYAGKARK